MRASRIWRSTSRARRSSPTCAPLDLHPGARGALHSAGNEGLRGHDRGRECAHPGSGVRHHAREEAHQHARRWIYIQERAVLFIPPGTKVYEGMIVGENARIQDLAFDITREKKLTNMRAAGC